MPADLEALKNELLALDRQLQQAAFPAAGGGSAAPLQSAQLAVLRQRLDERLATLDGSAWRLLLLEWRYDLALLFAHARLWMAHVDANFSAGPVPKP